MLHPVNLLCHAYISARLKAYYPNDIKMMGLGPGILVAEPGGGGSSLCSDWDSPRPPPPEKITRGGLDKMPGPRHTVRDAFL